MGTRPLEPEAQRERWYQHFHACYACKFYRELGTFCLLKPQKSLMASSRWSLLIPSRCWTRSRSRRRSWPILIGARTADIIAAIFPERCKALVSVSGYLIGSQQAGKVPLPPQAELQWWYQYYFATERGRAGYEKY